ncbi:MAG: glycosyltransferase family 2 protein [Ruminococcus sp.]|nr:glycosyltransferase family 2 protein [Ruminococcus sp.]
MVSIIIPVYNSEKTIKDCINSALSQSYNDVEIIAVNDGSDDSSLRILRECEKSDDRIKVVDKENGGVSSARNAGLHNARGEYVVFLDADDLLEKNSIERLVEGVKGDADLVIGSYTQFRTQSEKHFIKREREHLSLSDIKKDMGRYDPLFDTPWAKLFRRSLIAQNKLSFDTSLALSEDHKFNLQFIKHCKSISVITENVYYYRLGGMASANKFYSNKIELNMSLIESYIDFFDGIDNVPKDFLYKKVKDQFFGCVKHFYLFCSRVEAEKLVIKALEVFSSYLEADTEKAGYTKTEKKYIDSKNARGIISCVVLKKPIKLIAKKGIITINRCKR